MKNKCGFTLAETMITLGIVGIVAMLTVPTILNTQPNQELILVKKSYYNISRIVSELINDEDFYPDRETEETSGFSNTNITDQLGEEAKYHGIYFSGGSKFCGLFAAKLNTMQGGNPNSLCSSRKSLDEGGNFSTTDGITWSMPIGDFSSGTEDIYIDVNGPDKGKNCTRDTVGGAGMSICPRGVAPDRFVFMVQRQGGIIIPSKIGQLYASTTKINKSYNDFVRENSGVE